MLLTGSGLLLGGVGALASARVMQTLLYDTSVYDPWTLLVVLILLPAVAFIACYIPARRATRIDPLVALRTE
jgi:putative ABC transport system permease protein